MLNYRVVARACVDLPYRVDTGAETYSLVPSPISAVPPPFLSVHTANEWIHEKLKRLPTHLRGRALVVFDVLGLGETQIDKYEHLTAAFLKSGRPGGDFARTRRASTNWRATLRVLIAGALP